MADVKICDRCGKRLTDERMTFSLMPVPPTRFTLFAKLYKKGYYSWDLPKPVDTTHDLCVECTTKLSEWMEGESKEEE